jgi:hypothetical protein
VNNDHDFACGPDFRLASWSPNSPHFSGKIVPEAGLTFSSFIRVSSNAGPSPPAAAARDRLHFGNVETCLLLRRQPHLAQHPFLCVVRDEEAADPG